MRSKVSPELLSFVRSRIPMLVHDLAARDASGSRLDGIGRGRRSAGSYSLKQAFFYQAEWWINSPALVSREAYEYARLNWANHGDCIWNTRRSDIVKHEGRPIGECGLIWEHVYTGGMFARAVDRLWHSHKDLDAQEVAQLLADNFQTAWITRQENARLPKSDRGTTLADALQTYRECGIEIVDRPSGLDPPGSTTAPVRAYPEPTRGATRGKLSEAYDLFFARLGRMTRTLGFMSEWKHSSGRHYAYFSGSNFSQGIPEVSIELRGPRDAKDVFLTASLPTTMTDHVPDSAAWYEAKAQLGEGGELSFGANEGTPGQLCRYRVKLADGFAGASASAAMIRGAADRAASALATSDLCLEALRNRR